MPQTLDEFNQQVGRVALLTRAAILTYFEPESCIESTRLAIAVYEALGMPARPMAVKVAATNAWARVQMRSGNPPDKWPVNARSIAIGWRDDAPGPGWNGHLVVVLKGPTGVRHMMDVSADQLNRPPYLNIGGPVGLMINGPWTPTEPLGRLLQDGSTQIEYAPLPATASVRAQYLESIAWNEHGEFYEAAVPEILKALQESGG